MSSSAQGRGRGRGVNGANYSNNSNNNNNTNYNNGPIPVNSTSAEFQSSMGRGRGRGRGVTPSSSVESSFSNMSISSKNGNDSQQFSRGLGLAVPAGELASLSSNNSSNFWASKTGSNNLSNNERRFESESQEEEGSAFQSDKAKAKESEDERHLRSVFLMGLNPETSIDAIKQGFSEYGEVFVKLLTDKDTGEKKGTAFVEFSDMVIATRVLDLRDIYIDGMTVRIDAARPRKKDAPENFKYASSAQRWELPQEGEKASAKDEDLEKQLFIAQNTGINFDKYDNIPCEVTGENIPEGLPITSFAQANLDPLLLENINLAGYTKPTPVQKYAVPIGLRGRDIMACAQTGSGKTAAFLFPVLSKLFNRGPYKGELPALAADRPSDFKTAFPEAIIMAPTRELASQIFDETCKFAYRSYVRPCAVYGGADIGTQQYELEKGCTILVATPGRLTAMIARGSLHLGLVRNLILDEADRMLDMGFEKEIRKIIDEMGMPPKDQRQTMMFSATFPDSIQQLAADFLNDYLFLTVGRVGSTSENITQRMIYVKEKDKEERLMELLSEFKEIGLTLVFLKSKRTADALDHLLRNRGFNCTTIHGDLEQWEREEAIRHFKSGQLPILIATDVASRGLDIPSVTNVVNYDLTKEIDDYVHRIGRTGRVGRIGVATSFVNHSNWMLAPRLCDFLRNSNQEVPEWLERIANGERDYDRGPRRFDDSRGGGGFSRGGGRGGGGRGGGFGGRDRRYKDKDSKEYGGANDYSDLGPEDEDQKAKRGGKTEKGGASTQEMKAWDRMALREKRFQGDKIIFASSSVV